MRSTTILFTLSFILLLFTQATAASSLPYVFKNKKDGYNLFRIPAIVTTKSGKVIAFCEGRKNLMDNGNIDIVMKTSADNGITWSALKVVWNDSNNTCGNPAPVIDQVTGDVIVPVTMNNNRVFVLRSTNEGETWLAPMEITTSVKPGTWKWYATGPVHSIQLITPPYTNRLIVPCNHTVTGGKAHISHIIYSDDHGKTWQTGGSCPTAQTDECTVVETGNGNLLLNMRNNDRGMPNRKISRSNDGGLTWSKAVYDSALIEPVCQGALLKYAGNILLFSNPHNKHFRQNLTLAVSNNSGESWQQFIRLKKGKSAYSDIAILKNGDIICLFESGKIWPYGGIVLKTISRQIITGN